MQPIFRLFLILCLFGLSACEIAAPKPEFEDIRFSEQAAIRLDVAQIKIDDRYRAPLSAPNVEHKFPIPPVLVLKNWARDRLQAVGVNGTATLVIFDASVIEEKLTKKTGLTAFFTNQQSERYNGHLKIVLQIQKNNSQGRIEAVTVRSQTVAENASLNDRDRAFYQLTKDMIIALDQEAEAKIKQQLTNYLR